MSRTNLVGTLPAALEELAESLGASRYRGRQLATWIYRKGVRGPRRHDRSAARLPRARLGETAEAVPAGGSSERRRRRTAAASWSFRLTDGVAREAPVLMPDDGRITAVSVHAGRLRLRRAPFCLDGHHGPRAQSTAPREIVGQLMVANALAPTEGPSA